MLKKIEPIQVSDKDPFQNDLLDRRTIAGHLTSLVGTAHTPLVIAIDGAWGTGKTTFLNMWQRLLENNSFITLGFNAWENDYSDEPGVSFIGEIQTAIEEHRINTSNHPSLEKTWDSVKRLGAKVFGHLAPVAIKIATHGAIDAGTLKRLASNGADEIADELQSMAQEEIDRYAAKKRTLSEFKKSLEQFAEEITTNLDDKCARRPLVFLIDELDRCRPTYAVELLERLKHIFNVRNIVFVIAIDKQALSHSIRAVYGQSFDSTEYLRRFIDFRVELPMPDRRTYCNQLFIKMNFVELYDGRRREDINLDVVWGQIAAFATVYCFSLRTIEQAMAELYALVAMTPKKYVSSASPLAILVALKHAKSELLDGFLSGRVSANDLISQLARDDSQNVLLGADLGILRKAYLMLWSGVPGELQQERQKLQEIAQKAPENSLERREAEVMANTINRLSERDDWDFDYVKKRLRLLYTFAQG